MKKQELIDKLTSAGIEIPSGATVAILLELATANDVIVTSPVTDEDKAPVSAATETDPITLEAIAEVQSAQPAPTPKGISEQAIAEKTAAGLTREQAIEVIKRQIDWDKHPNSR
jgi:hypothetical protein